MVPILMQQGQLVEAARAAYCRNWACLRTCQVETIIANHCSKSHLQCLPNQLRTVLFHPFETNIGIRGTDLDSLVVFLNYTKALSRKFIVRKARKMACCVLPDRSVLLIPQFCPQRVERLLGTVWFLEPVYPWSRSAAKHFSEVSHWLLCIQFRAESRSRFFLRFYSFYCGAEAGNREILRLTRRTLENRRKPQRTDRIDCAIAGRMDTLYKDPAGKAPVAELSTNQGPPSQAGTVPFRVDEDRIGGSAIFGSSERG